MEPGYFERGDSFVRLFVRSSASGGKGGAELRPGSAAFPAGLTKTVPYVVITEDAQ